jgi:TolA-binding protein
LLLAAEQRAERKYTEANVTLHKFVDQFPKHPLITTAWMGMAANLESLGKTDEALSTYQRLAAEYPQSFNAPLALLAEVTILKEKNQFEQSRKICETVMSQYRDNVVASLAVQELMALPKPEAPPAPAQAQEPIPMERPAETAAPSPAASASPLK